MCTTIQYIVCSLHLVLVLLLLRLILYSSPCTLHCTLLYFTNINSSFLSLSLSLALPLSFCCCCLLAWIHVMQLMYRDIKHQNIILRDCVYPHTHYIHFYHLHFVLTYSLPFESIALPLALALSLILILFLFLYMTVYCVYN